jgi:hypothetical protein
MSTVDRLDSREEDSSVCMGSRASENFSPPMPVGSWDSAVGGYRTRYGKA